MPILIKNGTVVNSCGSRPADVLVEGSRIAGVGKPLEAPAGTEVIDAAGCFVIPGFIDPHAHFELNSGGMVTADNFLTGGRAAVLGGTTTVLDSAIQKRGGSLAMALDERRKKAEHCSCNYGFHIALSEFTRSIEAELNDMAGAGVTSYRADMVYESMRLDDGSIYAALRAASGAGALVGMRCENHSLIERLTADLKARGVTGAEGFPLSRPAIAEAEAVARFMRLAQLAGAAAYVLNLSTEEGLNEALRARERGQEVYLETCPQYLLLDDERYKAQDAGKYVMAPPLRKRSDNQRLWKALASGELDTIGTDHCPFTMKQKDAFRSDFTRIPLGSSGLQHRAQLIYTYGFAPGRISMEKMVEYLSFNPAKLFGMPDRGEVAPKMAADIVIWDPSVEGCITDTDHAHNCDNSPFAAMAVRGGARDVILNGKHVVSDWMLLMPNEGEYIHRKAYGKLR